MVRGVTGAGQELLFMAVQLWKCAVSGSFLVTPTRRPLVRLGSTFTYSTNQPADSQIRIQTFITRFFVRY